MSENPLITYCVFSYNQSRYIRRTVESVFKQKNYPVEIVISDDHSTDDTFDIIKNVANNYSGGADIVLNKNSENLGIGCHVSKVGKQIARGDFIVTVAGDDVLEEDHLEIVRKYLKKYSDAEIVDFNGNVIDGNDEFVRQIDMEEHEIRYQLLDYLKLGELKTFAPGRVVRRKIFTRYGNITRECPTEDSVLVLRALMAGNIYRINERIIKYRVHGNNISRTKNICTLPVKGIIGQFCRDLDSAYVNDFIDLKTKSWLKDRVRLEYLKRLMQNSKLMKNNKILVGYKFIYEIFYKYYVLRYM